MVRSDICGLPLGSAELVIAHAKWRRQRGRRPSMPFINERDPRKALRLAQTVIKADSHAAQLDLLASRYVKDRGKNFRDMTNAELKSAVRHIIRTSVSEEEVRQRVRDELGYSYTLALHTSIPDDTTGREARELVRGLGGLVMKNGAMAMAMMRGRDGKTISI